MKRGKKVACGKVSVLLRDDYVQLSGVTEKGGVTAALADIAPRDEPPLISCLSCLLACLKH